MSPSGLILYVTNLHWPEGLVLPPGGMLSTLHLGNPGLQAMLIRKAVWDEFGGFDEATDPSGEYDFDLRVMARLPVVVSKEPGAIQVMHHGAFTATAGLNHVWPCVPRIIDKVAQNTDLPPAIRQQAVEKMTRWLKQGLLRLGVMKSISRGEWANAQRVADILMREFPQSRAVRSIRWATAVSRMLPGQPLYCACAVCFENRRKNHAQSRPAVGIPGVFEVPAGIHSSSLESESAFSRVQS